MSCATSQAGESVNTQVRSARMVWVLFREIVMMQAFGVLAAKRQQKKMTKAGDRASVWGPRPIFQSYSQVSRCFGNLVKMGGFDFTLWISKGQLTPRNPPIKLRIHPQNLTFDAAVTSRFRRSYMLSGFGNLRDVLRGWPRNTTVWNPLRDRA